MYITSRIEHKSTYAHAHMSEVILRNEMTKWERPSASEFGIEIEIENKAGVTIFGKTIKWLCRWHWAATPMDNLCVHPRHSDVILYHTVPAQQHMFLAALHVSYKIWEFGCWDGLRALNQACNVCSTRRWYLSQATILSIVLRHFTTSHSGFALANSCVGSPTSLQRRAR